MQKLCYRLWENIKKFFVIKKEDEYIDNLVFEIKSIFDIEYRPKMHDGVRRVAGFNEFYEAFPFDSKEVMMKVWRELVSTGEIVRDSIDNEWVIR